MRRSSAAARSTTGGVDGDSSGRPSGAEVVVAGVEVLAGVGVPFGVELVLAGLADVKVLIGVEVPVGAELVLAGLAVYGGAELMLARGLAGVEVLVGADVLRSSLAGVE